MGASEERICTIVVTPSASGRTIASVAGQAPATSAAAPLTTVGALTPGEASSGARLSSPSRVLTANSPAVSLEIVELVRTPVRSVLRRRR